MYFSPFPCHLVPLMPKYSPQHPILKHPQPKFLPQCERPSFTPIQNNRQAELQFIGGTRVTCFHERADTKCRSQHHRLRHATHQYTTAVRRSQFYCNNNALYFLKRLYPPNHELTFKRRIKSHLPFEDIIRSSPYSTRFQDKG